MNPSPETLNADPLVEVHLTCFQSALSYAINFQLARSKKKAGETFSLFPAGTYAFCRHELPTFLKNPGILTYHHAFLNDESLVFPPVVATFSLLETLSNHPPYTDLEPCLIDWPSVEFFLRGFEVLDSSQVRFVLRRFFAPFTLTTKSLRPSTLREIAQARLESTVMPLLNEATIAFRTHVLETVARDPPFPDNVRFPRCKGKLYHQDDIALDRLKDNGTALALRQFIRDMTFIAIFHPIHRIVGLLRMPPVLENALLSANDFCHCLVPYCVICDRPASLIGLSQIENEAPQAGELTALGKMASFAIQDLVKFYLESCNGLNTAPPKRSDEFWKAFFSHPEIVGMRKRAPLCLCWTATLAPPLNCSQ